MVLNYVHLNFQVIGIRESLNSVRLYQVPAGCFGKRAPRGLHLEEDAALWAPAA